MSYHLGRLGREHLILERGRIGERWRSERWDSLTFQFPNWMVRLPGFAYEGNEPEGFMNREAVMEFIEAYARRISPPVRCGVQVRALRLSGSSGLDVETDHDTVHAANVVVATGPYQVPRVPAVSAELPPSVCQVTANRYKSADQLPPGNVLVVGAGGSGCQIAEDLVRSGRHALLSVGRHRRVPRRYRGNDFGWWQEKTGASDRVVDPLHPAPQAPLLTGVQGGHDVDFRDLARQGVVLLGSLGDIRSGRASFVADLHQNLASGDAAFHQFTEWVDRYILVHELDAPEPPPRCLSSSTSLPVPSPIRDLDISGAGISAVVWATGYRCDFGWIACPVFDVVGMPIHRRGVTAVPGLYFLGLARLHKVKSAFLWGVGEDAAYLAEHIVNRS